MALAKQATVGRIAFRSSQGGDSTAGFTIWQGVTWKGHRPGLFQWWMFTDHSGHLWRAELPSDLPVGAHAMAISTTDRYGRTFKDTLAFEVVETQPDPNWQKHFWSD